MVKTKDRKRVCDQQHNHLRQRNETFGYGHHASVRRRSGYIEAPLSMLPFGAETVASPIARALQQRFRSFEALFSSFPRIFLGDVVSQETLIVLSIKKDSPSAIALSLNL
jgi:hypothetical protein